MDTELLKTFLEIEKTRQFGRAAENLYLTPAAVSARIRQLEGAIGQPLFMRHRNQVRLTPAGERLKPYAENILENWNRALQESPVTADLPQHLSIGGTPNLWDFVLQDYLHKVYAAYPAMTLRAQCHDSAFIAAQIQARQLDMAVLFDPVKSPGVVREKLADINLQLVSTEPGLDARSVDRYNYVQVDWGVKSAVEHARFTRKFERPRLHASTGRIALDFLLRHGGSVYLPEALAASDLALGKLHPVTDAPAMEHSVYLTYLQDSVKKNLLQALVELLLETAPKVATGLQSSENKQI